MRATAQVCKITAGIDRHRVGVDAFNDFNLIVLAQSLEARHGIGLGQHFMGERLARVGNALHFSFNGGKIFGGEGLFNVKVVVKAGIDGRPDGDPGSGEEFFHRRSHDVRGGVADHLQTFGRIGVHGLEVFTPGGNRRREIKQALSAAKRAGSHDGLEPFAAQGFLEHGGHAVASLPLNHLPFHTDFHEKLLSVAGGAVRPDERPK